MQKQRPNYLSSSQTWVMRGLGVTKSDLCIHLDSISSPNPRFKTEMKVCQQISHCTSRNERCVRQTCSRENNLFVYWNTRFRTGDLILDLLVLTLSMTQNLRVYTWDWSLIVLAWIKICCWSRIPSVDSWLDPGFVGLRLGISDVSLVERLEGGVTPNTDGQYSSTKQMRCIPDSISKWNVTFSLWICCKRFRWKPEVANQLRSLCRTYWVKLGKLELWKQAWSWTDVE